MLEYSYSSISLSVEFEVHLSKTLPWLQLQVKKIGYCCYYWLLMLTKLYTPQNIAIYYFVNDNILFNDIDKVVDGYKLLAQTNLSMLVNIVIDKFCVPIVYWHRNYTHQYV